MPSLRGALSLLAALGLAACGGSQKNADAAPSAKGASADPSKPRSLSEWVAEERERRGLPPEAPEPALPDEADADNPHQAALLALLKAPWGARNDKDDQLHAPTPDWERWRRVRFWGFEHFTGFKYRKDHHVVAAVLVQDVPAGTPIKSETCMRRFEAWGRPQIKGFDVKFGQFSVKWSKWRNQPLMMTYTDGQLNWGVTRVEFSAAWAAYPAYPNACLIYAIAVPWRDEEQLARKVRDRWVEEGFVHMNPLTAERPQRKP